MQPDPIRTGGCHDALSADSGRPAWIASAARTLQLAAVLGAWLGVSFSLRLHRVSGLSRVQVRGLALIAAGVLTLGLLLGIASDTSATSWRKLQTGVARLWLAALPLAALPSCSARSDLRLALIVLSALLAAGCAPAGAWTRLGEQHGWRFALLGVAACLAVAFVAVGHALPGSSNNDAAYYFGMARHLAQTGRWTEPIVWHFLDRDAALPHAPFDYWHGLISIVVAPFLALCGATHRMAGTVMGAVSGASLLLFAYLIGFAAPLRNAGIQLLALLLFALSPALVGYRFDVETLSLVHVCLLCALIALARRRFVCATVWACLSFASRADTATLAALLCGSSAYLALRGRAPGRALLRVVLTAALCALVYVGYHAFMFGQPGPPGALIAATLVDGDDLYRWLDQHATLTWSQRRAPEFVAERVQVALDTLQRVRFFPLYPIWLGCALVAAKPPGSERRGIDAVARCLLFAGAAAIALASPAVFAWWRSLHVLLPVFVAAGAYGADRILDAVSGIASGFGRCAVVRRAAVALATVSLALALLRPLHLGIERPSVPAFAEELATLDGVFGAEPVMMLRPWYALAYTHAPAVELPLNGERAIAQVMRRYRVRWLVVLNGEGAAESDGIVSAVRAGRRADIGGIPVQLRRRLATLSVFRID